MSEPTVKKLLEKAIEMVERCKFLIPHPEHIIKMINLAIAKYEAEQALKDKQ